MSTKSVKEGFKKLEKILPEAKGIEWDGCHRIYVLMDEGDMMGGFEFLVRADEATPTQMLETLKEWWDQSCKWRFIMCMATSAANPRDIDFVEIIPQQFRKVTNGN